jgi:hypothetical protein
MSLPSTQQESFATLCFAVTNKHVTGEGNVVYLIWHHVIIYGNVEAQLHIFLTLALHGVDIFTQRIGGEKAPVISQVGWDV